jgi:hypothetical protein
MKRKAWRWSLLGLLLCASSAAWAVTRINGNQLLESTGEYGFRSGTEKGAAATNQPRLIYSVGQGVMAQGELPDSATGVAMHIGAGLGYDIAHYIVCPVGLTGDLSGDATITAADLIQLVRYIYKSGARLSPCAAVGDVNCSGDLTATDAVILVNFIFKSGPPPCNICSLIPDVWPCQ